MKQHSAGVTRWLGLCPKSPVVLASQVGFGDPQPSFEGSPGGGAGGSGTIRRGIGAAFSGMRTLNRNRQLLWFTVLAGLVLAGNITGQGALSYINRIIGGIVGIALSFFIEFATLFCLMFLLAGLVLSITSEKRGSASFIEGLAAAKKYFVPILLWSFMLALAAMVLYISLWKFLPFRLFSLVPLTEFPFTLNLNPSTFAEVPGYAGRSLLFWTYPYGFGNTLTFSAINLILFVVTPFVVPLIVLEKKPIREAIAGSYAMMKKTWAELAICAVFLGVVVYGVFLTYLLIQVAHGIVTPPELHHAIPTGPWIALGFLYYLTVSAVAFVMAAAGGIAALDLYRFAKAGSRGSTEPETVA